MCVSCFGLVVSTCQVTGYRKTLWWHLHEVRRLSPQSPGGKSVCVYFSFVWFVYVAVSHPCPMKYLFHTRMARYSLFVLKMPSNTNKTNKTTRKPNRGEGIVSIKPSPNSVWLSWFIVLFHCLIARYVCIVPRPYVTILHTSTARYSLFVLKVPLNTKQTNKLRGWKNRPSPFPGQTS